MSRKLTLLMATVLLYGLPGQADSMGLNFGEGGDWSNVGAPLSNDGGDWGYVASPVALPTSGDWGVSMPAPVVSYVPDSNTPSFVNVDMSAAPPPKSFTDFLNMGIPEYTGMAITTGMGVASGIEHPATTPFTALNESGFGAGYGVLLGPLAVGAVGSAYSGQPFDVGQFGFNVAASAATWSLDTIAYGVAGSAAPAIGGPFTWGLGAIGTGVALYNGYNNLFPTDADKAGLWNGVATSIAPAASGVFGLVDNLTAPAPVYDMGSMSNPLYGDLGSGLYDSGGGYGGVGSGFGPMGSGFAIGE